MSVSSEILGNTPASTSVLPPLEPGDRLTRAEFERRYAAMPHLKKAELIEGVVQMAAAVRFRLHGQPHAALMAWLATYMVSTPGVLLADNASLRLDLDNEPQPDAAMCLDPDLGGQARISRDDYLEGAPEFVAEVASSSASYDLGDKFHVYCRHGVREYLVWRVLDRALDWHVLRQGRFELLAPDARGTYRSEVFPGLWLDASALLDGTLPQVMTILNEGLRSPEHEHFLQQLQTRRK